MKNSALVWISILVVFVCASSAVTAQSTAKVYTVNSTADSADATPGDAVCADAQGRCTLRAAVEEANAEPRGKDIIIFSLQYPAVIDLTVGPLVITGNGAYIVGPGARRLTVQRSAGSIAFRIFHVPNAGTTAVIRGLSVANGNAGELIGGGAVRTGPGAVVNLTDAALRNNSGGVGGAVLNEGTMTISRVLMTSNTANVNGGAIATATTSTTRVLDSTITNNAALTGGGIYADAPFLCVNCTIARNTAALSASSIRSGLANEVALLNTIVGVDSSFPATSLSGTFLSHGNNLVTDARGSAGFANGVNNDKVSDNNAINPQLGQLANNGGQTDSISLLAGSPAINAGNSCVFTAQCPAFGPFNQVRLFWDQRVNYTRGGMINAVDIGAYEFGSTASTGSASFGSFPGTGIFKPFFNNTQAIITNAETGEKIFKSIGISGGFMTGSLPTGVVYIVEVRTKRPWLQPAPFVSAYPD